MLAAGFLLLFQAKKFAEKWIIEQRIVRVCLLRFGRIDGDDARSDFFYDGRKAQVWPALPRDGRGLHLDLWLLGGLSRYYRPSLCSGKEQKKACQIGEAHGE